VLIVFAGFCAVGAEVTSDLLGMMGVPEGCRMESERLRAAGSMSGMVSKVSGMGGASTIRALSQLHLRCSVSRNDGVNISAKANPVQDRVTVGTDGMVCRVVDTPQSVSGDRRRSCGAAPN
jgi:hypothetical protein